MTDVFGHVIDVLADTTNLWVDDHLPADRDLSANLPCIVVEDLPSGSEEIPWGSLTGPLTEVTSLDIEIFGSDRESLKPLGRLVTSILYSLVARLNSPVTGVSIPSTFARRPDWNPNIVRIGAEFDLRAPY